jgi:pimeloyl-ACP methyl ester carboxylesterase
MAAPPPIDAWAWFLDNWKLIRLDSKLNAQPISGKKFPIVAYSHGLGGSAIIYSHQTRSLAANGHIVISVDHTDGSAPVVMKKDGSIVLLDTAPIQIFLDGKREEYARTRRAQTEWRARELTGATVALQQLNEQNTPELEALGVSFVDCLDTTQIHAMGHSFGGATALTVAFRRPDLFHSAIAHEPATDWSPDDVRKQIFPHAAIGKWEHEGEAYTGGVGGYQESEAKPLKTTYHQMPVLYLFSDEWYKLNWGNCRFIEQLHKQGSLGLHGDFGVITSAHHNEFSDMCFLTPLWLARALKVTGIRNPIDTAADMVDRTLAFLEDLSPASALQKKAEEVTA